MIRYLVYRPNISFLNYQANITRLTEFTHGCARSLDTARGTRTARSIAAKQPPRARLCGEAQHAPSCVDQSQHHKRNRTGPAHGIIVHFRRSTGRRRYAVLKGKG